MKMPSLREEETFAKEGDVNYLKKYLRSLSFQFLKLEAVTLFPLGVFIEKEIPKIS